MSTRLFLGTLIVLSLAASFALTALIAPLVAWLPADLAAYAVPLAIGIVIALAFFLIVDHFIMRPLQNVCAAMSAFVDRNERQALTVSGGAPKELREFARIFQDFAERVEAAHARDVEISRVKSDFISTAAHQLRTPLTGIRWALEALEKEPLSEQQQVLVKSATDKAHDLVAVVGTLLDISSIESGKHAYNFANDDLQALIIEVLQDFSPAAAEAQVSLEYVPLPMPCIVRMDRDRIKWVLNNLIENGIRYTPAGGQVSVTCENLPGRAIVKVRDTGIGIPQKDRNNIFERFYRAGNAITKQNQGNGLGLYIARTIVKDHQGELSFENNAKGPGTTFTLALPAAR